MDTPFDFDGYTYLGRSFFRGGGVITCQAERDQKVFPPNELSVILISQHRHVICWSTQPRALHQVSPPVHPA
jgi:hypothetical protein